MHHIFYHANCADGFAARCIAQLALGTANVAYWPIHYEGPQMSPAIEPRDQVTYLDYTPPPSILEKLITEMQCRVLVIDHHDTAKKIQTLVKQSKMKVQAAIQGDAVRITGAKKDELQAAMAMLRKDVAEVPLSFNNFRD